MNILAIGAHPDDCEEFCAGTLALYRRAGHRVVMCSATNGNIGSTTLSKEETARVRLGEARRSAAVIGAEYICLDYDDELLYDTPETRMRVLDLMRYAQADVVFTHPPRDYCPDHECISKIVHDAIVMVSIPNLVTEHPPYAGTPCLYYFESQNGVGFVPEEYVDITETMETKKRMYACHESQAAWMSENFADSYAGGKEQFFESIVVQARYRGLQCGVTYAEGFSLCRDAFRIPVRRLLP